LTGHADNVYVVVALGFMMSIIHKEKRMRVFVVVTRYMHGIQDEAVFSSMANANSYLNTRGSEGSPDILDEDIRGEMQEGNKVFTASTYDPSMDVHFYEGVYGSYESAKQAAGEKGQVLTRVIDDRLD
jgi:hypothetical protein